MHRILLRALPKLLLSRVTGRLARLPLPGPLRRPFLGWFVRRYGCELAEVRGELGAFPSLAAFFQRELAEGARPIDPGAELVWPCDGRIVSSGPIHAGRLPEVKGRDYALAELVRDAGLAKALQEGSQATVYLAPGDYHRVHAPFDGTLRSATHLRGGLFPVHAKALESIPGLFVRNEREVLRCVDKGGRQAAVVLVAALNVGDTLVHGPFPRAVAKGEELGRFRFGSTVVVLVEAGGASFLEVPAGTRVRMGAAAQR